MEQVESLIFLALCLGVPLLMFGILGLRAARWVRDRFATSRIAAEGGWADVEIGELRAALEGAGIPLGKRITLHAPRARGALFVVRHRRRGRNAGAGVGSGSTRRLLVLPRPAPGPLGVVEPRLGGALERVALGLASALGADPSPREGWEWAIVGAPGPWLDASRSDAVRALLGPGERLHLGPDHVALSLPDGPDAPLLQAAEARADAIRAALEG